YSDRTDDLIFRFQKRHSDLVADAVAGPLTFKRMSMLAAGKPSRCVGESIEPTPVVAVMTKKVVGHTYVKGYDGKKVGAVHPVQGRFKVPLYELRLGVASRDGKWTL